MNKAIIIITLLLFATVSFAQDDITKLIQQKNQINVEMIKLSGAIELNNVLIRNAARRSLTYDDQMIKLRDVLGRVNAAIKKLEATPPAPEIEKAE